MPSHLTQLFFNNHFDKIEELFLHALIHFFATSLIGLFIPIYLIQIGYSLTEVLFFYAVYLFVEAGFTTVTAKICCRYGCKHIIAYSVPFLLVFLAMLYSIETYHWPLWLVAIPIGIQSCLFWFGYHGFFSQVAPEKHKGEEIAASKILIKVATALGPLIGGIMLSITSFQLLIIVVSILLGFSLIPLFHSPDLVDKSYCNYYTIFKNRSFKEYIPLITFGSETAISILIWPLVVFFEIIPSYSIFGFITFSSVLLTIIVLYYLGTSIDKDQRKVVRFGAFGNVAIWITRIIAQTNFQVLFIDFFRGLTFNATIMSIDANLYDEIHKNKKFEYIVFRQIMINMSRGIMFLFLILFISVLNFEMRDSFWIAMIISIFYLAIPSPKAKA